MMAEELKAYPEATSRVEAYRDLKSTKMWMRMITTKWDRRKVKRIMRLQAEGK